MPEQKKRWIVSCGAPGNYFLKWDEPSEPGERKALFSNIADARRLGRLAADRISGELKNIGVASYVESAPRDSVRCSDCGTPLAPDMGLCLPCHVRAGQPPVSPLPPLEVVPPLEVNGDCTIQNPEGLKVPSFEDRYSDNFPSPSSPDTGLQPSECSDCNRWEERFWKLMDILDRSQERSLRLFDKLEELQKKDRQPLNIV